LTENMRGRVFYKGGGEGQGTGSPPVTKSPLEKGCRGRGVGKVTKPLK